MRVKKPSPHKRPKTALYNNTKNIVVDQKGAPALLVTEHAVREQLVHARQEGGICLDAAEAPPLHDALLQPRHDTVHSARAPRAEDACRGIEAGLRAEHAVAERMPLERRGQKTPAEALRQSYGQNTPAGVVEETRPPW